MTLNIVAVLFLLVGTIWFLQGINVLPGSFMTGQTRWAVYGGIAIAAGITLLWELIGRERALIKRRFEAIRLRCCLFTIPATICTREMPVRPQTIGRHGAIHQHPLTAHYSLRNRSSDVSG